MFQLFSIVFLIILNKIKARKKILWIHNEAKYLLYWHRLKYLLRYRPIVVFSGKYHKSTLPFFIPTGGRKVIPFGIGDKVLNMTPTNSHERNKKIALTCHFLKMSRSSSFDVSKMHLNVTWSRQ